MNIPKEPKRLIPWWACLIVVSVMPYVFTVEAGLLGTIITTDANLQFIEFVARMTNVILGTAGIAFIALFVIDIVYLFRSHQFKKKTP